MTKRTCWTAIILGVAAVAYAAWLHVTLESRIAGAVEDRLHAKEQALVRSLQPRVEKVYQDFGMATTKEPKTLDELIQPFITLLDNLSGRPDGKSATRPESHTPQPQSHPPLRGSGQGKEAK